jgi:hypothetical protein
MEIPQQLEGRVQKVLDLLNKNAYQLPIPQPLNVSGSVTFQSPRFHRLTRIISKLGDFSMRRV